MGGEFAQNAALIAVAIVTALIGVFKYIKTEATKTDKPQGDVGQVLAASFVDARLLRELIETLRVHAEEFAREGRNTSRKRAELITALEENTDAVLAHTDASVNLIKFLKRKDFNDDMANE